MLWTRHNVFSDSLDNIQLLKKTMSIVIEHELLYHKAGFSNIKAIKILMSIQVTPTLIARQGTRCEMT